MGESRECEAGRKDRQWREGDREVVRGCGVSVCRWVGYATNLGLI